MLERSNGEFVEPTNHEVAFHMTRRFMCDPSGTLPNAFYVSDALESVDLVEKALGDPENGLDYEKQADYLKFKLSVNLSISKNQFNLSEDEEFSEIYAAGFMRCFDESDHELGFKKTAQEKDEVIKLASRKGASVASIYQDDKLYAELMRSIYTPEEFASTRVRISEKIFTRFPESMVNVTEEKQDKWFMDNYGISSGEASEEFARFFGPVPSREQQIKLLEATAFEISKGLYEVAIKEINEYWGENAFSSLPQELQDKLTRFEQLS